MRQIHKTFRLYTQDCRSCSQKILMVGPSPEGLGGIARVISLWAKNDFFSRKSIKYIETVNENKNKFLFFLSGFLKFSKNLPKCSCVFIHTASFNSFYRKSFFLLISILLNKKIVLHIHPTYFFNFLQNLSTFKKKLCMWLLKHVDAFIVLTDDMKKKMNSFFPEKKIYVLPNPVDVQSLACFSNEERSRRKLLFLGWYVQSKGVYDLVDAIEILDKEKFDISIDFYGTKEIAELKDYVNRKKLNSMININGWANDKLKKAELCDSAALVLPSYTEGIPNVILEAMATKTPIIATSVGGLKEILRDNYNALIIQTGNPNDIAQKIKIIVTNPSLAKRIAENAFKEAKQKYDLPIVKASLQKILNNI